MSVNICLDSVSLNYPIYSANSRSLKRSLLGGLTGGKISSDQGSGTIIVKALENLSIEFKEGDKIGLIGHNGAGKSSLLKILAGVYPPSLGSLNINGKIASLLNIAIGMDQEATGYENIYIRGLILGLKKQEIKELTPDIEEFTELGKYLSMPVRTYSSGMRIRLAFAISTSIKPEILLLDEVIGVGDAHFMQKAQHRLHNMIDSASIFILASHENEMIEKFCNKALWLEHGKVKEFGPAKEVIRNYENSESQLLKEATENAVKKTKEGKEKESVDETVE